VAAVAAPVGFGMMAEGWASYGRQSSLSFAAQFWAWIIIAGVPLVVAAFRGHWGLIPPAAAIICSIAMPWCQHGRVEQYNFGQDARSYVVTEPNLLAHLLTAAFALFVIVWGMRRASRALVNLGVIYFGLAVGWFYFSNIFDKVGRSLGLIGLGVLFLAGGWGLEIARRRLLARMDNARAAVEVGQ
jgi:hypothetical protein